MNATTENSFQKRDRMIAIIDEILNFPKTGHFATFVGHTQGKVDELLKELDQETLNLKDRPNQDGHSPTINKIIEIPQKAGEVLFSKRGEYDGFTERLCKDLFIFLDICDKLTNKLGKSIWCTVSPDDRILWGFKEMEQDGGQLKRFESFISNLSYKKLFELSKRMPLRENEYARENIIERLLAEKKSELLQKVAQSFTHIQPDIDIESIFNNGYHAYKDDFPEPVPQEIMYGFVVASNRFSQLPTGKLIPLVDKTRSVVLAKALLEREDYRSSFEKFMLSVELSTQQKKD